MPDNRDVNSPLLTRWQSTYLTDSSIGGPLAGAAGGSHEDFSDLDRITLTERRAAGTPHMSDPQPYTQRGHTT